MENQCGYTLIESLFQLLVFVAFMHLFVLFFFWKAPIENQYSLMSNTGWELFAADIQAALIDLDDFEVYANQRGIKFKNDRGVIDIEQRNGVIRKKVDGLGHIPFLTHVQSANFTVEGVTLVVDVTMLDGTRKERDFAIGFIQK